MTMILDLYWSFRSPYSYLAIQRYMDMVEIYDIKINLRPVYPLAIRQADFFEKNHPNWLGYTLRDMIRVAQFHNIKFAAPNPDPIVQNMMTREISDEQPYIYRLTRLGQAAARHGKSFQFCHAVSAHIWGGTEGWDKGNYLSGAAKEAGLDINMLDKEAIKDAKKLDEEILGNQNALEAAGHWGVPTLVIENEPFFGQDRIEMVLWRLQQLGLRKR